MLEFYSKIKSHSTCNDSGPVFNSVFMSLQVDLNLNLNEEGRGLGKNTVYLLSYLNNTFQTNYHCGFFTIYETFLLSV